MGLGGICAVFEKRKRVYLLHIGIDLDNTILDATTAHLYYYNQASGLSFTPNDVNDFNISRLYGWNKSERDEIYQKYGHDIHWNSSPFPNAIEVLHELFIHHQISIITARPEVFREVTIKWLEHHGIKYHNINFTEEKLNECLKSKIDVLIDDAPHYANELSIRNIPVILFDQPYNNTVASDLVHRANSWLEIKRLIHKLDTKCGS